MTAVAADLVVVGGGPVGLAAAIQARLAGLSVVVVEPREGPIDKACGEGLMPGAVPLLAGLGVRPVGRVIAGIGYYGVGRSTTASRQPDTAAGFPGSTRPRRVEHRFEGAGGLGVRRTVLHTALAVRARELEVEFATGRADALSQTEDSVTVTVGGRQLRSTWLFGCDGLHSTVARLSGLALPAPERHRYGIRQHFAVEPWTDLVEVHYGPTAELYVTPVADDTVGVAMLGRQGARFVDAVATVPALAERLAGADAASQRRGAGPLRQRTRARTAGRVLLVGDASGYVDALTGEGMRLGFEQAQAAIACIVGSAPERYEREWRHICRDFRLLTGGLVAWADSPLRGAIVPAAATLPKLFGAIVERLAR